MKSWKNPSHHSNFWWTFAFKWNFGRMWRELWRAGCFCWRLKLFLMTFLEIILISWDFPREKMLEDSVEKFKTRNYDWRQNLEKKDSTTWQVINRFTNRITSLGGGAENLRIKYRQIKRSFSCRQQTPQSSLWINRYAYEFVACLIFSCSTIVPKILLITHWTCAVTHDIYAVTYFRQFSIEHAMW